MDDLRDSWVEGEGGVVGCGQAKIAQTAWANSNLCIILLYFILFDPAFTRRPGSRPFSFHTSFSSPSSSSTNGAKMWSAASPVPGKGCLLVRPFLFARGLLQLRGMGVQVILPPGSAVTASNPQPWLLVKGQRRRLPEPCNHG